MQIAPYGGRLVDRIMADDALAGLSNNTKDQIILSDYDMINLYNLAVGCYSPLDGFMTEAEYQNVLRCNKLPSGLDWTIPILLGIESRPRSGNVMLCDKSGVPAGSLQVESVFEIDKVKFCKQVFNSIDANHPGVRETMKKPSICIGGKVSLSASKVAGLRYLRTPKENREWLEKTGKKTFTAFSTRNICHIGHEYLHGIVLETSDILSINVITGAEVKGNFLPDVVFDTYEYLLSRAYPEGRVFLNNLRLPSIYAGPKEAFLQAIILQNHGFTHFVVGRDHAGVGSYYPKYGSQQIFELLKDLDINILSFAEPRFCKICGKVTTEKSCRHSGDGLIYLNGRDIRRSIIEKKHSEFDALINKDLRNILIKMIEEDKKIIFS